MKARILLLAMCLILLPGLQRPKPSRWLRPQRMSSPSMREATQVATEHRWINGGDGDWGNTASWHTAQVPGAGGVNTDTAIFGDWSQVSVTTGLDRVAAVDNPLLGIITRSEYAGDVGNSGAPLYHDFATAGRVIHRGSGQFFLRSNSGGAGANVIVDSSRGLASAAMTLTGASSLIANLFVKAGHVEVVGTVTIANHIIVDGPTADVEFLTGSGVSLGWLNLIWEGNVVNNCPILTTGGPAAVRVVALGGKWRQLGLLHDTTVVITAPPAIFEYVPSSDVGASNNASIVSGGSLVDTSESHQDIEWDNIILGQGAALWATMLQSGNPTPLSVNIDLREEYP